MPVTAGSMVQHCVCDSVPWCNIMSVVASSMVQHLCLWLPVPWGNIVSVAASCMVQHCVCGCQFHGATLCLWLPVPWGNIVSVVASSMGQHCVSVHVACATLLVCPWHWFLGVTLWLVCGCRIHPVTFLACAVFCVATGCSPGALRLRDGTAHSGRVEICNNNIWGSMTMCAVR